MNSFARSIMTLALAASAVYLLDPVKGRRRRLMLYEQCLSAVGRLREIAHYLAKAADRAAVEVEARGREGAERAEISFDEPAHERRRAADATTRVH